MMMARLWSGLMAQNSYGISSATSVVSWPSIQFIIETESDSVVPFLDVLVIRKGMAMATKVYGNPT
jgi:hypothetical protein